MQRYRIFVCVLMLLGLSACRPKRISKKSIRKSCLQESIARLSQIPDVPLGVHIDVIEKSEKNPDSVQIICRYTSLPVEELKMFYVQEMERLGWYLRGEYEGAEILLHFVRPSDDMCTISIRPKKQLVVTLMNKKEASY